MVLVAQVFGEGAGNARIILNNQDFHGLILGILRKPTDYDGFTRDLSWTKVDFCFL
jgi:hypothetical protein